MSCHLISNLVTHNPLVVGSSPTGPTILKAAHCAAFCCLRKKQLDQSYGPQVQNQYSANATVRFWSSNKMATIVKTDAGTWKALVRKTGWPANAKTFRTKRDAEDWARRTEDEMVRGVYVVV